MNDLERQKLLDCIVLYSTHTKNCGLVKLFKLLYFTDMLHFGQTGRTVTGLDYSAWQWGPVPRELFFETKLPNDDMQSVVKFEQPPSNDSMAVVPQRTRIIPVEINRGTPNLTTREKRIAKELIEIFYDVNAEDISVISHAHNGPWDRAWRKGPGTEINKFDSVNIVMGSVKASKLEELVERAEDHSEGKECFG